MTATHTAIATTAKGVYDAIQVPTETPGDGEILIKVDYASMIAFDTYVTDRGFVVQEYPLVLGFNAAGIVAKLGSGVEDLKVGDRVIAFGIGSSRNKTMQEYCIESRSLVAKIPDTLPLEEAATIPDNFVCAFYTLFSQLGLPIPSTFPATVAPPLATSPILIYGAGSTAGLYAIQLLHLAGYKKIIATASLKHHDYLRSLGATDTFDYNSPTLVKDIAIAAGEDRKILFAMDCITTQSTLDILADILSPLATLAILLPIKAGNAVTGSLDEEMYWEIPEERNRFPKGTKIIGVRTFNYQEDSTLKQNLMPKILPQLLAAGHIKPNRVRLMDKGTFKERVGTGLALLRENKISGEKVIVKVAT